LREQFISFYYNNDKYTKGLGNFFKKSKKIFNLFFILEVSFAESGSGGALKEGESAPFFTTRPKFAFLS